MNNQVYINANMRFKARSDIKTNWESANPILLSGEVGVVTDGSETEKIKLGDGVNPWNELGYWKGPKGDKGDIYVLTESDKHDIAEIIKEDEVIGNIENSLDNIIVIQNSLIGGESE